MSTPIPHCFYPQDDNAMSFNKQTPTKYQAFLAVLSATCNVGKSCDAIEISRMTAYTWRKEDPAFAAQWDEALKIGQSVLEDEAFRRAHDGVDKPVFQRGIQVGCVREYSDGLLTFILKAADPKKYRDNTKVELSGDGGGPIKISDEDKAERIRTLLALAQTRKNNAENDASDLF